MPRIDLKKDLKHLYSPPAKLTVVDVPPLNFLKIDGEGNPNTAQGYRDAIEALFSVSYTLKFMVKKSPPGIDYGVMPLEGLWWVDDMARFSIEAKDDWKWTAMIMQPDFITADMVTQALDETRRKKNPPALDRLRFEPYHEGLSVQTLYTGPFADEGPTIARLHQFIEEQGGQPNGHHHEIYLSDFRRTAPEKLKTVIRQPFRK